MASLRTGLLLCLVGWSRRPCPECAQDPVDVPPAEAVHAIGLTDPAKDLVCSFPVALVIENSKAHELVESVVNERATHEAPGVDRRAARTVPGVGSADFKITRRSKVCQS